jgi:hypothetical protein
VASKDATPPLRRITWYIGVADAFAAPGDERAGKEGAALLVSKLNDIDSTPSAGDKADGSQDESTAWRPQLMPDDPPGHPARG